MTAHALTLEGRAVQFEHSSPDGSHVGYRRIGGTLDDVRHTDRTVSRARTTVDRVHSSAQGTAAVAAAPAGRHEALWRQVVDELRWSFKPPCVWLSGVAFNAVLSLLWLAVVPLTGRPHHDWAIIVGSYFVVWILADVTTTNMLGADALRVRIGLLRDVRLRRILLIKNLALLLLVGVPTLLATAIITVATEADYRLTLTLSGVLFPILTWLGVGNVASVVLPVATVEWRERWRQRRNVKVSARWAASLALPYALLGATEPVSALPRLVLRQLHFLPPTLQVRGAVLCVLGLAIWGAGTALALGMNRVRPIRIR